MLAIVLLSLLLPNLSSVSEGAPLNATISSFVPPSSLAELSNQEIQFDKNYRSPWNILWACLSVVFTCTWTAVHPNVYGYGSTQWQRTKRRTLLFLLALFFPEVNLIWSVKQWS